MAPSQGSLPAAHFQCVSVGDSFILQVYFDLSPTLTFSDAIPPTLAVYAWFGESYSMSVAFGNYYIVTTDNIYMTVRNSLVFDGPIYQSGFGVQSATLFSSGDYSENEGDGISIGLFSSVSQPQTGITFPDASLESVIDYPVADFNQKPFRVKGTFNGVSGDVNGQITSYHIAVVPEPSAAFLSFIGAIGSCFCRNRRISG